MLSPSVLKLELWYFIKKAYRSECLANAICSFETLLPNVKHLLITNMEKNYKGHGSSGSNPFGIFIKPSVSALSNETSLRFNPVKSGLNRSNFG